MVIELCLSPLLCVICLVFAWTLTIAVVMLLKNGIIWNTFERQHPRFHFNKHPKSCCCVPMIYKISIHLKCKASLNRSSARKLVSLGSSRNDAEASTSLMSGSNIQRVILTILSSDRWMIIASPSFASRRTCNPAISNIPFAQLLRSSWLTGSHPSSSLLQSVSRLSSPLPSIEAPNQLPFMSSSLILPDYFPSFRLLNRARHFFAPFLA